MKLVSFAVCSLVSLQRFNYVKEVCVGVGGVQILFGSQ